MAIRRRTWTRRAGAAREQCSLGPNAGCAERRAGHALVTHRAGPDRHHASGHVSTPGWTGVPTLPGRSLRGRRGSPRHGRARPARRRQHRDGRTVGGGGADRHDRERLPADGGQVEGQPQRHAALRTLPLVRRPSRNRPPAGQDRSDMRDDDRHLLREGVSAPEVHRQPSGQSPGSAHRDGVGGPRRRPGAPARRDRLPEGSHDRRACPRRCDDRRAWRLHPHAAGDRHVRRLRRGVRLRHLLRRRARRALPRREEAVSGAGVAAVRQHDPWPRHTRRWNLLLPRAPGARRSRHGPRDARRPDGDWQQQGRVRAHRHPGRRQLFDRRGLRRVPRGCERRARRAAALGCAAGRLLAPQPPARDHAPRRLGCDRLDTLGDAGPDRPGDRGGGRCGRRTRCITSGATATIS